MLNGIIIPEENLVEVMNGEVVVSSRTVAEKFEREHGDVIESIRKILKTENSALRFFHENTYKVKGNNKTYPEYLMNRNGFALLAMGFNGEKALKWKLKYIDAFNMMEERLKNPSNLPDFTNPAESARAWAEQYEKTLALEEEKKHNAPYITYGKAIEASVNSVLIRDYAKALSDSEGVNVGEKRLYQWLRDNKYLMDDNMPYQKYIDNGYFEVTSTSIATPSGIKQRFSRKITGRGQIALAKKIADAFARDNSPHKFVKD